MTKSCLKLFAISFFTVMLAAFTNGWKNGTRLEVVDRYGPHGGEEEALYEILAMDQLRVQSLQFQEAAITNQDEEDTHVQIPAESGKSLGSNNYVVTIGLGTPKHELTLVIDTASDITWTQCLPCYLDDCFPQKEPMFRPSESTTYSRIPCESQYCADLGKRKRGGPGCRNRYHDCTYEIKFIDGSSTTGFYGRDRLSFSMFEVFYNFRFGCSNYHTGKFGRYAGILGLGRGPASFVSQNKNKYRRVFSYCLPDINTRGFLSFGPGEGYVEESGMVFTPFMSGKSKTYYYIEIIAISVGGTQLPIPSSVFTSASAIIDSGAVLTHLPPAAYKALSEEYTRQMGPRRSALAYSAQLDTCFHVTEKDQIPSMSFTFRDDATISIQPSGILLFVKPDWACLAFAGNKNPGDMAIFGSTAQKKMEVLYDVPRNQLGFRSNPNCF